MRIASRNSARIALLMMAGLGAPTAAEMRVARGDTTAADTTRGTVMILPLALSADIEAERASVRQHLQQGLQDAGLQVTLTGADLVLSDEDQRCDTQSCLGAISTRVGARFLVFSQVVNLPDVYTVSVRVRDASTGAMLGDSRVECASEDPCPPMAQTVADGAREAGQKAARALALIEPTGPPISSAPAPVAAPTLQTAVIREAPPTAAMGGIPAWLPVTTIVTGSGLLVGGAYLFSVHGEGTDCTVTGACRRLRDTKAAAIGASTAGAITVATGITLLLLRRSRGDDTDPSPGTQGQLVVAPWVGSSAGLLMTGTF